MRANSILNMVVITDEPFIKEKRQPETSSEELRKKFKRWNGSFLSLFDAKAKWTGWPILELEKADTMAFGAVGLAGDAAHAMLPFAAQGAAMAIEDAAVLGDMFSRFDKASDAMETYEKERLGRVNKMMKMARKNGRIYHMNSVMSEFRDLGMWMMPNSRLEGRQDWIYGWGGA